MFQNLNQRLAKVFDSLKGRGSLSEKDITAALREVRVALLEADVALPVVKQVMTDIKEKALGEEVLQNITPVQQVIKIVHDRLVFLLGEETVPLNITATPPAVILIAGLQGSGKTTTTAKLAHHITKKLDKSVLMASTDIYRPAAREQLQVLGEQINVPTLSIRSDETVPHIVERAQVEAKLGGFDVLMVDTAGRLHIDTTLMDEIQSIHKVLNPTETLLVADAMTGQDAVQVAETFHQSIPLTGLVLTRLDGDARGGAALSMRSVTGCPIKFAGMGEKVTELEVFHPDRIARRILDMGDVVTLVEKAAEAIDQKEAEALSKRMQQEGFTLSLYAQQLKQMEKMGGLGSMMKMLPGVGKIQNAMDQSGLNDQMLKHQLAIIQSMTKQEKKYPKLLDASRKRRIALGAGRSVMEVNRVLKQFRDMQTMMKRMQKQSKKGRMGQMMQGLMNRFPGGGPGAG